MEEYPVYINGSNCGSLTVFKDGLLTCLEAKCAKHEGLIRLYVFGGGKSAYLGIMEPKTDCLMLKKCFSRNDMRGFPAEIEYAADSAIKKEEPETDDGLLWFSTPQGTLTTFDGAQSLVAIPADNAKLSHISGLLRVINGREYIVFPGKRKLT